MADTPKLTVLFEKMRGKTFELNKDSMTVGRRDGMDICIKDPSLSGYHADIIRSERDGKNHRTGTQEFRHHPFRRHRGSVRQQRRQRQYHLTDAHDRSFQHRQQDFDRPDAQQPRPVRDAGKSQNRQKPETDASRNGIARTAGGGDDGLRTGSDRVPERGQLTTDPDFSIEPEEETGRFVRIRRGAAIPNDEYCIPGKSSDASIPGYERF